MNGIVAGAILTGLLGHGLDAFGNNRLLSYSVRGWFIAEVFFKTNELNDDEGVSENQAGSSKDFHRSLDWYVKRCVSSDSLSDREHRSRQRVLVRTRSSVKRIYFFQSVRLRRRTNSNTNVPPTALFLVP